MHTVVRIGGTAAVLVFAAACGSNSTGMSPNKSVSSAAPSSTATIATSSAATSSSPTTTTTTSASNVCNLVNLQEARAVLGADARADLSGSARCIYRASGGKELALEPGKIPSYSYPSLAAFKKLYDGTPKLYDSLPGLGDAAYFDKATSALYLAKGAQTVEIKLVLDPMSSDYDPTSDKAAEKAALVRLAGLAVTRMPLPTS